MRNRISFVTLGVALAAGTSVVHAQTLETIVTPASAPVVIAQAPVGVPPSGVLLAQPPLVPAPVQTFETVQTERTTTPAIVRRHVVHRRTRDRLTTTRTTTVQQVVATAPGVAAPAPYVATPVPYEEAVQGAPLYDVVAPVPAVAAQPVVAAAPVVGVTAPVAAGAVLPLYRYVYEPGRILVIDPATNIAIQAIPR